MKNSAATRFYDNAMTAWDSPEPWENTARDGLSDEDQDILIGYCNETGEGFAEQLAVLEAMIREKVSK